MTEGHRPPGYPPGNATESMRAEEEEQLAYYALLQENTHDAVIATDEQLLVTAWNKGAEQMYGWRADEVLGRHLWEEVVPVEMSEDQRAEALRELDERGRLRTEAITYGKDGAPVYVEGITIALRGEQGEGEITGYVNIRRDITERKKAEEALRESKRRNENILESITDAFFALDREWRYTHINERALRRIQRAKGEGLTREELLGKNAWEMFPEAVGSETHQKYHEAVREQKPIHFETYSAWSDRWIEHHAYPSEEGLSVYFRDITERKQAEQELREAHRRIENVLESITDQFYALDREGRFTYINERALGYAQRDKDAELTREDVLGKNIWEMFPEAVDSVVYQKYHEAMREQKTVHFEMYYPPNDRWAEIHAYPSEEGLSVYWQDITERKRAEEKLEEVREAERSRIARDLHDEALQDLTDALVQTQQIQSLSEDPQQTLRLVRLLATLDRIGPQLRGAIYDLRLEGEKDRLFPELLESLVELHRGMSPESDIALEVHDGVPSGLLGERGRQLLRIIGEALTNVRRHSRAHNVRVGVGITEGKLWAEVEDDGRGFDMAEGSEQETSASGGMGIRGMKERARSLGGDLKIESDPQTGTKVRFEMALEKERKEDEPEEEVRVLLVEDHATLREALVSTFEQDEKGFEVVGQAGSLAEARRMLAEGEQQIDVAVIDLGLPDGFGGDLIKDLREAYPQAQALVLSVALDRAQIARAVEAGAAGVMHKRAHLNEVVEAVRRLRRGETLLPLEEVVELLRFAGSRREEEHKARRAIEKLTPREIEVLQALAEGLDSEGIADKLHIALRTERNHMANILTKLELHSQLQALVFALRHGVVEIG
jgi:PAS domain S-box-containing protein